VQAKVVVDTIRWIDEQLPQPVKDLVLTVRLLQLNSSKEPSSLVGAALQATHEWARVAGTMRGQRERCGGYQCVRGVIFPGR